MSDVNSERRARGTHVGTGGRADRIAVAASPDAETVTNEKGAKQSKVDVRFDLIDGPALFEMAAVLDTGAKKYGPNNWRGIDVNDHLNHLIMHAYAYLSGDRTDDHLSHIMCRSMFAQAVAITDQQNLGDAWKELHPNEKGESNAKNSQ